MCIRDRHHRARRTSGDHGQELLVAQNAAAQVVDQLAQREACLLYTSDAADERSSVDLGGRRIIKKKTTIESGAV